MFPRGKHGTFLDDLSARVDHKTSLHQRGLSHAQERTLRLIIVVVSPESVLPDVLAIHTIEMIPKSMILT
jgi:phage terminase large subunit-like protein